MFIDFLVRFIWFWMKVSASCVFVLLLQLKINDQTLENMLESTLKNSSISRHFHRLTKDSAETAVQDIKKWVSEGENPLPEKTEALKKQALKYNPSKAVEKAFEEFEQAQ